MSSPDFAGAREEFRRDEEYVRFNEAAQFDRGARAFAFCCGVLYAVLSGALIVTLVKAAFQF
jgi:hypothetical protein